MTARTLSWTYQVGRWLYAHPYTTCGCIAGIVLSTFFLVRIESEWEYVYIQAAYQLRHGYDIYQPEIGNSYPPFATLTALPFTALPNVAQRWLWLIINLGCLTFMLRAAWRLAGGGQLEGANRAPLPEHLAAFFGGLCGVFSVQNAFAHQQTDVVLGALLFGGCLALNRERSFLAATCFGLAAAVKCTPLLWAPYLLWRRQPVAAAWLVVVAVGVNLLPDLVQRPASGNVWLTEYVTRMLLPIGQADHYAGTWYSALIYNQSLAGAGQRWCTTVWEWTPKDCVVFNRAVHLGPAAVNRIVYGVEACLVLLTLAICRRPFQRLPVGVAGSKMQHALEYSVVFVLMLLCSPMSSKAHFGVLLLPGFCLARAACVEGRRWLRPLLGASVLLALATNKGPLGEHLYTLSLWFGCVTWEALVLLAGCFALLALRDRAVSLNNLSPVCDETSRRAA